MKKNLFMDSFNRIRKENENGIFNTISFFALCLLLMDCAISGGGRWLMIGPISYRMLLGIIAALCAIPSILRGTAKWIRNPIVISLVLFVAYMGISAWIGVNNGNRIDVLLSDLKGFSWLLLVPVAIAVMNSRERFEFAMRCVIFAAILHAVIVLILNIICIYYKGWFGLLYQPVLDMQFGFIGVITSSMVRIFTKSAPYLIIAVIFMAYFAVKEEKYRWLLGIGSGLCINTILMTFTRSLYGAAFVAILAAIIFLIVFTIKKWKRLLLHMAVAILAAAVIVVSQQLMSGANYTKFAIARTFSLDIVSMDKQYEQMLAEGQEIDEELLVFIQQQQYLEITKDSDNIIRETTLKELKESIQKSPIFGNGLGASINFRPDGLVEYFYHDLMNKMGIVGSLLYCFPLIFMLFIIVREWKRRRFEKLLITSIWIAGLLAFFTITYYNPYMNAALGIICYSMAISGFLWLTNGRDSQLNQHENDYKRQRKSYEDSDSIIIK